MYRGRGRGRGRGHTHYSKEEPYEIFPDITLPKREDSPGDANLSKINSWLETFWKNSEYHLKTDSSKKRNASQGPDIERYGDKLEQKNKRGQNSLRDFLVLRKDNFALELMGKIQQQKKKPIKNEDSDLKKLEWFAKLEDKGQDGKNVKEEKGADEEDEKEGSQDEEEEEESDGDYAKNEVFDDDEDDYNMEEEIDEPYYDE